MAMSTSERERIAAYVGIGIISILLSSIVSGILGLFFPLFGPGNVFIFFLFVVFFFFRYAANRGVDYGTDAFN